ncbi:MAG: anti-sigma factor family protein [Myxococcota bacterium]
MAAHPACQTFIPQLSPFIDGELTPADRVTVERHLAVCKECTMRTADLRAESGLLRVGMEMLADEVDFKDFSQKVLARITPDKPPFLERLKLSLSEMFLYQRGTMLTALATAAVVMLVALPFLLRGGTPVGYAQKRLEVQTVRIDDSANVAPVVMETDSGDAIVWTVEPVREKDEPKKNEGDEAANEELGIEKTKPKGGEL